MQLKALETTVLASHEVLASVADPTSQDHRELREKRSLTYGLPELSGRHGTRVHPKMRSPGCPQGPHGPQDPQHSDVEQSEHMGDAHDAHVARTPELQRQPSPKVHAAHLRSFKLTAAHQIDQVDQAAHIWVHSIHQAGLIPKETLPRDHQERKRDQAEARSKGLRSRQSGYQEVQMALIR